MKIGELAEAANTSADTIRYYEQRGLIPAAARTASGYRIYQADDVRRLNFIAKAKTVGFTLSEIKELLSIRRDGSNCKPARSVAEAKAGEIKKQIEELSQMRRVLLNLSRKCKELEGDCPILEFMEAEYGK